MQKQNRTLPMPKRQTYEPPEGYWAVGNIVGVHGLRGEVKVELYTDFPERFEPGGQMLVGDRLTKMEIETVRLHKAHLLLKFKQVAHREQAELLRNQWLLIEEEDAISLEEGAYWIHEILGLQVKTVDGKSLGEVTDVLHTGANDVYVVSLDPVRGGQKELLLPAIAEVVQSIDMENETMLVALLPGMMDSE